MSFPVYDSEHYSTAVISYVLQELQPVLYNGYMNEHPERFGWWLNELESLGVSPKRCNELNDKQEVSKLTENLKQIFIKHIRLVMTRNNSKDRRILSFYRTSKYRFCSA
jgi:hypothetical protein